MMDLLGGQIDYVYFAHGLALMLLASTARALSWRSDGSFAWKWLAVFGLSAGLSEWLDMGSLALGQPAVILPLRGGLMLVSSLTLLQFCRASGRLAPVTAAWVLGPMALVAGAGHVGGVGGAEIGFRYCLVFPGAAWACWLFLRRAPASEGGGRRLKVPGWAFALVALTSGLTVPAAGFVPASLYNERLFGDLTGIPIQYVRALAGMLLALGLWRYYCRLKRGDEHSASAAWRRYERGLSAALSIVVLGGWAFTGATTASERAELRASLEVRAATVAAMVPPGLVERLNGTASDAATAAYVEAQALLASVCGASTDVMSAALIGRRGDSFRYLAEAYPRERRHAGGRPAAPGEPYRDSDDAVARLLPAAGLPGAGRHVQEGAAALSTLVPVRMTNGQVVGVLDLKVDPAGRRRSIARARLAPILLTLLTSLLLIAFFVSERKMAESTAWMAASERRYRGLVEGSPNGIMLLDGEGRCQTINHNGLTTFVLRDEDVVGRRLADLWPDPDRCRVAALAERVSKGERATLDTRYTAPDGRVIDLELVLNPVTDGGGRVTHQVGIVSDVTERQCAQSALERSHRFTQVILGISARFLNLRAERVDAAAREALREVGSFLGVDRAQLFHLSADRTSFSLTHEWCTPGTASRLPALQSVPVEEYPWIWSLLEKAGLVLVDDVAAMSAEAALEHARMSSQGVGAFLCVPVHRRGQVTGFLALDVFGRHRDWPGDEVTLLRIAADVLSNGLARKMADEALRESEQRFQRAFRNNPAAMAIVWTENQRIVEVNDAFLGLLDRRIDEVVGRTVDEIQLIDGDRERECFSAALVAGEQLRHLELRISTGNGERRHISLSMDAFELGGERFMLAVALDLSARVQAEEALRDREEVFRSISAAAQDGIIMIDSDARVTVWNDAAERMFGYSRDEAEGRPLYSLILPEDYEPGFMEGFGQFRMSGDGPFIGTAQQVLGQRKDGTQIPVELSASAVKIRERWHAVGILRDITERLKVDEALWKAKEETEAANDELQRSVERANRLADEAAVANASKSEFLANMSHEIRTPMNGIIGMTGLLLDTRLEDDQREYADTVRSCADSLLTIINDILDFSKIEAGKLDLEALDFDLAGTIGDTIDVLAIRARQKGLDLVFRIDPSVPAMLRGDPGRLRQVLTNLIGNAIKFTAHGEVALGVTLEAQEPEHAVLRFVVRDTGIGIPAGKVDQLFQPFTQVDASTTRRFGGTGLGLSISRRLAGMMGGTIGVESEEGVGSRFWFTARFERQPEERAAANAGAPRVAGHAVADAQRRKLRLLLAEDNITNQKVAIKVLEKMGHRVDAVANGVEAIKALRTMPYDLVFMDVQMPEMDGLEATRRIRDPETGARDPRIPIVAMTAHAMKGDRERCLEAGMDDYVSKPISPQHVANAIARRLDGQPVPDLHGASRPADGPGDAGTAPSPGPAPEAAGDPGLPDRASLLTRLGGDEEVFVEVIKIFLEDVPKQLSAMDDSLAAGDAKTLRRLAHTLKGSSGTAGAEALQRASLRLEEAAAAGDLAAAAPLVPPVKQLFAQVLATMSVWVSGDPSTTSISS
jgi:PAS domain S-box-containing protein